ncbi:MAG: hypothetical protein COA78_05700 [Blastopirellula sp.]|nr:MAG: hypothetical protein COA78_05700 [Blastopirellula sp.]
MDAAFLSKFKEDTESRWARTKIAPNIYGFQFQPGTKWNSGLSVRDIDQYEELLGTTLPNDFRLMLQHINGTDRPNLNVYGSCGEPHRTTYRLYTYPRDLEIVREQIKVVQEDREEIAEVLLEYEEFNLPTEATLFPIYGHRYLVCAPDRTKSRVLSVVGADVITYGLCLQDYLLREFLN